MIIGKNLSDIKRYIGLSKNLDFAIKYILEHDLNEIPLGKHVLDGDEVILNREAYDPKPLADCSFESHENYLDIQIVLSGKEGFGYCHASNEGLVVTEEYNSIKDVKKYQVKPELVFEMSSNAFAIVYPEDLHMPKIKLDDSSFVQKAIFKVKL